MPATSRFSRLALVFALFALPTLATAQAPNAQTSVNASTPASSKDTILFDFEGGSYEGWTLEGDCWGKEPATAKTFLDKQGKSLITGSVGSGFLITHYKNPAGTGKAVSKDFPIDKPFLTFHIGGGHYPNQACLNLVVDGKIVRSETGSDSNELRPAYWDVSSFVGKLAHLEVVDAISNPNLGYIILDKVISTSYPPFYEQIHGQNSFLCFEREDAAGRGFQKIFSTLDGKNNRALTDYCVNKLTAELALKVKSIDRSNIDQCKAMLYTVVSNVIKSYQVKDVLSQGMIAANANALLTAMLTRYDYSLADYINKKSPTDKQAFNYVVEMRKPIVVLQRGKAVCGGIAGLEQELAISLKEFGIECYNIAGYTRRNDLTPNENINHRWTIYSFCANTLWAPSDTTGVAIALDNARLQPIEKIGRNNIIVVDPLLRDIFALFHHAAGWKIGWPGKSIKELFLDAFDYQQWVAFNETHKNDLTIARNIAKRIEKEDNAKTR